MTNHAARLYALAGAVLVFFVAWAAIAAHPWRTQAATAGQDPRLAALQIREQRLRAEALAVQRIVDKRWAVYRAQLVERKRAIAAVQAANARARAASLASARVPTYSAPSSGGSAPAAAAPAVRIVTLPPVTITRTS